MVFTEREKKIIELVGFSRKETEPSIIKKGLIKDLGNYFDADMVYLFSTDLKSNKLLPLDENSEYLKSQDTPSFIGKDAELIRFFNKSVKTGEIIIVNEENFITKYGWNGSVFDKFFKEYGVKSCILARIVYQDVNIGLLAVIFREKRVFSEEDMDFMGLFRIAAGGTIYQATLLLYQKKAAEREALLRKIVETIRKTLDADEIINILCRESALTFNVERVAVVKMPEPKDIDSYVFRIEYKSSAAVPSIKELKKDLKVISYGARKMLGKDELLLINNMQKDNIPEYYRKAFEKIGVKSQIGVPIKEKDKVWGAFVLSSIENYRTWTDEEIEAVRIIADQVYIGLNQANLYEEIKKKAEKETLLRQIISEIKISQSIDEAYNYILAKLANIFNTNRSVFIEVPHYMHEKAFIKYEYSNENLPPIKEINIPQSCLKELKKITDDAEFFKIDDTCKYFASNKDILVFFEKINVKSVMLIPLIRYNRHMKLLGIIALCSSEPGSWKTNEIDLLKTIAGTIVNIVWDISKLNEIEELRNTFMLTLAHDLQVPVVGEQKALEYINSKDESKQIKEIKPIINDLMENNTSINHTLTKLIDIYSYEMEHKKLQLSSQKVEVLVYNVNERLNQFALSRGVDVCFDSEEHLPNIMVDRDEIEKAIGIILKNAIEYSPKNEKVNVKIYKKDNYLAVCITDKGPGFPPEFQEQVFKRYEMIKILKRKIGAGLSLYLAKLIIQEHKGLIQIDSIENSGMTFCVYLPL